jgi:hypothetical protein
LFIIAFQRFGSLEIVADLEAQMFKLAQMYIKKHNVQPSTDPASLPNALEAALLFVVIV